MSRVRLMPHPTVPDRLVDWGQWRAGADPLPTTMVRWPPKSGSMHILSAVELQFDEIVRRLGTDDRTTIAVAVVVDSRDTGIRTARWQEVTDAKVELKTLLDASDMTGSLAIERSLVILTSNDSRFVPGARLGPADKQTLTLGDAREWFPTAAVSFVENGYPASPWHLNVSYDHPDDGFLGSVRLLINTDHPAAAILLVDDPEPGIASVIRADVVRRMLDHLASDERMIADGEWHEDSVAAVADRMCATYLRSSLPETLARRRQDPWWDTHLHARLALLKQGGWP